MNARLGVLLVVALVVTSCTDDDDADPTTTQSLATTPPTTAAPTTAVPSTLPATTTTVDPVEAIKAEVAAAFLRTNQLREDLSRNPTLEGLEDKLATIAVPGSPAYIGYLDFVQGLVERGERVVPGSPDWSEMRVESVELVGDPSSGQAVVTACSIDNQVLVRSDGSVVEGSGGLTAGRLKMPMQRTASGWLQTDAVTPLDIQSEVAECPAS